jgi:uncharacterized protein with von Willebrand factor type A (vWA) domain
MREDPGRHAAITDLFDRSAFAAVLEESPYVEDGVRAGQGRYFPFPQLLRDLFACFFRSEVRLREYRELERPYRFNLVMVSDFKASRPYERMHAYTVLNEHLSMLAAVITAEEVLAHLSEPEIREQEGLARAEEMLREQQVNIELIEEFRQELDDPEQRERLERLRQGLEDEMDKLREMSERAGGGEPGEEPGEEESEREAGGKPRESVRRAFEEAADKFERSRAELVKWGEGPGSVTRLDPVRRLELALRAKDSERLRKLFEMVGRFRMAAISSRGERMRHGVDEFYEIECGADLARLIPAEMSALANPLLKKDFFRRYHERRLLCYHLRRNDPGERGPLVVLVDVSYSMHGEKELWAKAVALALRELAWRKRRHCAVIEFGARDDPLLVLRFPPGVERMDDVVRMAEFFLGGGTDFVKPLEAALAVLKGREYREADMVLISDGDCPLDKPWVEGFRREKKRAGFNIYTVLTDVGHATTRYVSSFSDEVIRVSELTVEGAEEVFSSLPF